MDKCPCGRFTLSRLLNKHLNEPLKETISSLLIFTGQFFSRQNLILDYIWHSDGCDILL